jgi:tRNA-(ms[2]io[6]A)-hydroxylase
MNFMQPVRDFLGCATPDAWLREAVNQMPLLMQDHANCEKKAASTAMNLMFRYNDRRELQHKLAQLAREELLHYEQVMEMMEKRGMSYRPVSAGRYASGLRKHIRTSEPGHLVDVLIVGAFVEARSCERFEALAPLVDAELGRYYTFLLKSESRHFEYYLELAKAYSPEPIEGRVAFFREVEAELMTTPDPVFRFHSGVPVGEG